MKANTNLLVLMCLLLVSISVQAAIPSINNAGLFDNILDRFATIAAGWGDKMIGYASWLFWSLTLLSMVWTYGLMALKKADIQEFFAETILFFAVTGFFLWILRNGPAMSMSIINTLRQIAANASGLSNNISPSGIVDIGFDIASKVIDMSSIWSPASSIIGLATAAIILVILALVSINLLLVLISAWLLAYAGVFLLGFGGGRWTQDIAIQYYKTVLNIALQTFTMILIVGVGRSFIDEFYAVIGTDIALKELLVMLVVSIILLVLTNKLPPLIAGIAGGSGIHSTGIGGFGMGAAMGAAGVGVAGASYAMSFASGAASHIAGGTSAIQAAFQAAQQNMQTTNGASTNGVGGGLAAAMGTAGRFAMDMGANLAKGVAQTMGDKVSSVKGATSANIADTFGGQVASAIKNANISTNTPSSDTQSPSHDNFDDNSLSAAQSDEVNNFVNKST